MSFLAPFFLFGLLAAAIPVAIHLIRREKPPKIIFSTLRFIKSTTRKLILFQQIQQWLLLALRAALIVLLVFAFARPLFDSNMGSLLDAEPESLVLLLDTSLSMRYGDRFDTARTEALAALDRLSAGDEAAVITFSSAVETVRELSTDIDALRSFINALDSPGYDRVQFLPPLRLADDLLASARHSKRRIQMISDFQANGLPETERTMLAPGVAFEATQTSTGSSRNLSISDVRSPAQLLSDTSEYDILVRLRSTGSQLLSNGRVSLLIDGETRVSEVFDLGDTSETVITLPVIFEQAGSHTGEVLLEGDEFSADNSWFFTIDVLPRIQVLVLNGAPSANWYDDESHWLVLALEGRGETPFDVQTVARDEFEASMLAETDVLVVLNMDDPGQAAMAQIERFIENGGTAFLAPGDQVNAERFNSRFGNIAPGQLLQTELMRGNDYLLLAEIERRHPALRPLEFDWTARFEGIWSVQAKPETEVLARFDNAMPALLESSVGAGKVMMFASALDLSWSNLPLQGLFVPLMHESLRYLVQPESRQSAYQVGDIINLQAYLDNETELLLSAPGRAYQQLRVDASNPSLTFPGPGLFRQEGSEAQRFFAVNIDPAAAELLQIDPALLHDRIINPETTPQQTEQIRTQQLMQEIEQPQRIWWWILILVTVLLAAETLIANRTYR
ncbi:MAG: BatA domain-containing protein [Pseudomonadales bacterium]|nr:BatA domain-containing protein [Pseudomonadales bacterium]